jgi:peptidyl-dipeptidase A
MKKFVSTLALGAAIFSTQVMAQNAVPTAAEADRFVTQTEKERQDFSKYAQQAEWVYETYITDDSEAISSHVGAEGTAMGVRQAKAAANYQAIPGLSFDTRRKLDFLRNGLTMPAPDTPGAATQLNEISSKLGGLYAKGKGTLNGEVLSGNDLEEKMGTIRDPEKLKEMWVSWHKVGAPMRDDFSKMVGIANMGAKELGFIDTGAMWRSGYDMPPEQFSATVDKLWTEVKPLYDELHTYVRTQLSKKYGEKVQAKTGPIRADLLGNMWAQEWGDIYDLVAPPGAGDIGYDIGDLLKAKDYDPVKMVKQGEKFYTSLGFEPLPATFWERSQITRPRDREVACHASAWDVDDVDDLRIKMCTKVNAGDFVTIHHELGHNFYQRAYNKQPFLYRNGANDGFHEAIGDFIALSVTPQYLVTTGLLDPAKVPPADRDIGLLLRQAMDKVAFLPFGLLVDKWRWGVFDGSITPANYNKSWTELRLKYQGITPPVSRSEADFDAGAKNHVATSVPYARYFLARILQFQFFKSACDMSGWKGPLSRCTFYNDKKVGEKLDAMLSMGASKPWPDALQAFTGTREMSGKAMVEYFKPLMDWLKKQNKGAKKGW